MSEGTDLRIELIAMAREASEGEDRDGFERAIEQLVHPDLDWEPLVAGLEGSYKGAEGLISFYDDVIAAFEVRYEDTEYRQFDEDTIVELTTMRLRGRQSDVQVDRELGVIYQFDGDRLRHGRAYDSHARAIEVAEAIVA